MVIFRTARIAGAMVPVSPERPIPGILSKVRAGKKQ